MALAALCLALAGGGLADAKPKRGGKIQLGKGVAGVNLSLKRGPITVRRGHKTVKVHTVYSILGKPQQVTEVPRDEGDAPEEKILYLANYLDDALSVYYVKRNKAGKLDNKRDQYDKAVGVVTYTPRYQGPFAPGDGLDSGSDQDCAPLDSQVAPDGGKRRVSVCRHASGKRAIELIYMSSASPSRDGQTISQLGIFAVGLGEGLYDSLLRAALEDLGCEDPSCGGSG